MSKTKESSNPFALLYLLIFLGTGCASPTYQFGLTNRPQTSRISGDSYQLTFGGDHPRLDRAERWVHYPAEKLKQWFPDKEPQVDPEEMRTLAICKAQEYLVLNGLTDVNIDVREYDPATQWKRLRDNDSIHPIWKYTSGSMSHLMYTLIPGRVFRSDSFNPYTKTLSLNSTNPSMALYTAAEAKIIYNRRYPGAYSAACRLPLVGITKKVRAANDVLSYARDRRDWDTEKELTPEIYSDFGSEFVLYALPLVPGSEELPFYVAPLTSFAGSAAGEATGRAVLRQREKDRKQDESSEKH